MASHIARSQRRFRRVVSWPSRNKELDQCWVDYRSKYDGRKEDYFALLYLSKRIGCAPESVAHQIAFGGNDYGVDAFHADKDRNPLQDQKQNQFLVQLKAAIHEHRAAIDQLFIHFVFNGDPESAEQSAVLDSLREDLEAKKYLIDQFFEGRQVTLGFQFISNQTKKLAGVTHSKKTHVYEIALGEPVEACTQAGERLYVGLVPPCGPSSHVSRDGQEVLRSQHPGGVV